MKKAKILYIITQSQWGGAQRYVFDLATRLSGIFDVTVACGGDGEMIGRLEAAGVRVVRLKHMVREIHPLEDALGFWEIYYLIKEIGPDIVHTNSSKAEILGNLAAALARTPRIIHTAHGFVFNEPMSRKKKLFYILLERWANKFTSAIICVSDYDRAAALIHKIAPAKKLVTIHNGISIEYGKFSAKNRACQKIGDKFIITTIANFYATKGLPHLISAASVLSQKFSNLEFWLVGDGQERPYLEKLIARHKLKNIVLHGFQKNSRKYLDQSDLFVLPSVKEGFPYAVLEAMAAGLPIVATTVGGVAEAIVSGENGLLVAASDSQALAEKISLLHADADKRKKMSQNNLEKVARLFSLDAMIAKTRKVYGSDRQA